MSISLPLPRVRPTTYSTAQLFKDIYTALPSYFKKTDETFNRVYVHKLNELGQPRTIQKQDLETKKITILGPEFSFIENKNTGQLYKDECAYLTTVKCFLIFLATPFYTIGNIVWNAYQMLRSVGIVAHNAFHAVRSDAQLGRCFEAFQALYREIKPLPSVFKERLWAIIKAPFFGFGLEIAALSGIIRPLHGRHYVAMLEKAWHYGSSYKQTICNEMTGSANSTCKCIHSGREFFLAGCFLERGNVSDENIHVLRRGPLRPYFDE